MDPGFRKLKFISAEDGTRVKGRIKVLAIREAKGTEIHDCASTQLKRKVNIPAEKSTLDRILLSLSV